MSAKDLNTIRIGPYEPGDEAEILRVFNMVFGTDRSLEFWKWEYRDNPAGLHVFLAKFPDGQVVSQFCGVPRRMKVRDEVRTFAEIVDSFTDPAYRRGLKKPGLFASTCYAFVDHFGRPDGEIIMYGLPNPPAFRVGRALLGYVHLYDIAFHVREVKDAPEQPETALEPVSAFGADVDDLYQRFQVPYPVLTIRDRTYLNWRFVHPEVDYRKFELRGADGRLGGIAVLRHHWLDKPETAVAEIMVEDDHPEVDAFLDALEGEARRAGDERIKLLLRPDIPLARRLEDRGYVLEPSPFRFVARTYDAERVPLEWLKESWFISLGDFDIV